MRCSFRKIRDSVAAGWDLLDGLPGTGWFVTEDRARPVRLFSSTGVEPDSADVGRWS